MKKFTSYQITAEHEGLTLEAYLKQVLQYSGRRLQKLTRQKGVLLNGKAVFLQKKVKAGDSLRVLLADDVSYGVQPEEGCVEILYEDEYVLVLNKPAGLLVHPAGRTMSGTLANYLAYELQRRKELCAIRPLHRLDRDTSGCVIFAKDAHSQFLLEQQMKEKRLQRIYWALVNGAVLPTEGTIDAPLGAHPSRPNRRAVREDGEKAVTQYRTLERHAAASLLELTLETGRTHQIRLHASHLGHPLIGDGMYGRRASWMPRQALHAACVRFEHLKELREVTVQAPLPEDFEAALAHCRQVRREAEEVTPWTP
ncbi:RluA family pseudouridine synthase [uncultured Anaeromusa sp.]|uniref:RluA family pseudouridine synthase n=1 Tax=uncultured Anaeromusa sp. TaxID=673273 RepID=UPI0029C78B93|nr:RluA family pseudouridine synthase [uncultured Anaeromusa sp.]